MTIKEKVLKDFSNRKAYGVIVDLTLAEVEKVIDEMISFSEKKKKELKKREADLIEIVPHIDYVAVLKELKQKLGGGE